MSETKPSTNIFDFRIPIPWLLASVVAVVTTFAASYTKLDNISVQITKFENRLDRRDTEFQALANQVYENKMKIIANTESMALVRNDIARISQAIENANRGR